MNRFHRILLSFLFLSRVSWAAELSESLDSREERETVSSFVASLWPLFQASRSSQSVEFHFVLGNQSADLDSVASAIARAYQLSLEFKSSKKSSVVFPVINISREELSLRKDVRLLFEKLKIEEKNLIFKDEIDLEELFRELGERFHLHLVDHNTLNPEQRNLRGGVRSILDHHEDGAVPYPLCEKGARVILPVGSATTLVANALEGFKTNLDPSWASLLLSPIAVDTHFLENLEKTTELDTSMARSWEEKASGDSLAQLYQEFANVKNDISGMSPADLLRMDAKIYEEKTGGVRYSISSHPKDEEGALLWSSRSSLIKELEKFRKEKDCELASVLHVSKTEMRFFHIKFKSEEFARKLLEKIKRGFLLEEKIELEYKPEFLTAKIIFPRKAGRKKVQPFLEACLKSLESGE